MCVYCPLVSCLLLHAPEAPAYVPVVPLWYFGICASLPLWYSATLAYIFVSLHLSHSGTLRLCHFGICVHYMPLCRSGIQQLNAFRNTAKSTFSEGSWYLPLHALLVLHSKSPLTDIAYSNYYCQLR